MTQGQEGLGKLRILCKGEGWLAVHKPAGMTVHNEGELDLLRQVEGYLGGSKKVYLLNRLDAGTSGLVMFATSKRVASAIQKQFEARQVQKTYFALCEKAAQSKSELPPSGIWKWYLTKRAEGKSNPQGFQKMRVPCQTEWEVLRREGDQVYLKLKPVTGRKHQIRRHAALAGWPVAGDKRYGLSVQNEKEDQEDARLALEAFALEFNDPTTGLPVRVELDRSEVLPFRPDA